MAATFYILKAGLAPPGLSSRPEAERLRYWNEVVAWGLKRKDWELARGLNAKGEPLPGVALATRRRRRSAMTPSGRGDPSAPYLMPGRGLSRTRSLLAGKAHLDHAEFHWRYDSFSADQWGKVLALHARRGKAYDVVGLSPRGVAWVKVQAEKSWRAWIAAGKPAAPVLPPVEVAPVERVGRTNLANAVIGMGGTKDSIQKAIDEGRSPGFLSPEEWARYYRSARPAIAPRPGQAPSVSRGASNVLLQHVWGVPKPPPAVGVRKAAMPPVAPPKPKAPKPKAPKPPPPKPPAPTYRKPEAAARPPDVVPASSVVETFKFSSSEGVRSAVRAGLAAIEKVHGVSGMRKIEVKDLSPFADHLGGFVHDAEGDVRIELKSDLAADAYIFIHEFGHYIDWARLSGPDWSPPADNPELAAWWDAVAGTDRIRWLSRRRGLMEGDPLGGAKRDYFDYLLRPREIWARAYAQWVATRSGDEELSRQLASYVKMDSVYQSSYWESDDFAPVAEALDAVFRAMGWLK